MQRAVNDLENDIANLTAALNIVNQQTKNISDVLDDVIKAFDDISTSFDAEINTLVKSAGDRAQIGADAQNPSDIKAISLGGASTQANVKARQTHALTTLASIGDGVREMTDWTRAMDILVTETNNIITANRPLLDAFTTLSYVFGFLPASVKSHASTVVTFDNILCVTASNLILTEQYYRTFPLDSIRTQCGNSGELVLDSAYIASHQERAMTVLIKEYTNKGDDVQTITKSMQTFFDTDPLLSKAKISGPSTKETLCEIAKSFPDKVTYDFFALAFFRQPCGQITMEQFWDQEDLAVAAKRKYTLEQRAKIRG